MNIRFGLYFIPEDGPFYQAGSEIVGYDIRHQQDVTQPHFIDPSWTATNSQYGFHTTITDAIYLPEDQLGHIIDEVEKTLACFRPDNTYFLTKQRVGFWRNSGNMAVVLMTPNRNVEMLHDVLVTKFHPLGVGSQYFSEYQRDKNGFSPNTPESIQKTKQFYSPYIFEEFAPHFTCINSYEGPHSERASIEASLDKTFKEFDTVELHKISLVVQSPNDTHFHIAKEFSLHGNPKNIGIV